MPVNPPIPRAKANIFTAESEDEGKPFSAFVSLHLLGAILRTLLLFEYNLGERRGSNERRIFESCPRSSFQNIQGKVWSVSIDIP